MGKKRLLFVLTSIFAIAISATLCGCGKTELDKYSASISELREYIYSAQDENCKVTAISGVREEPYELNGISCSKRNFTVVTVTPAQFMSDITYKYRATINDVTYEGDLLPHPFMQSLSVDIPAVADKNFSFTVIGKSEQSYDMENAVKGENIGADKAFGIALNKLKTDLKKFKNKGKLNAEIYVRIMENPIDGSGGNFWYVAFVSEDRSTVAILLKADTGEVAAVRN